MQYCIIHRLGQIEYAFLLNGKEMRNIIIKREVAFYKKSFRHEVDPGQESLNYYSAVTMAIAQQEAKVSRETTTLDQDSLTPVTTMTMPVYTLQDSLGSSGDLIVKMDGEEIPCSIKGLDNQTILFAFFQNSRIMENAIDRSDVYYVVMDYQDKSTEKIIITPVLPEEFPDLIVTVKGEEIPCSIEGIDAQAILYGFFQNNRIRENTISKSDVHYVVRDHRGESPARIVITPNSPEEFSQLIITDRGATFACFIDHVGLNTVEYYMYEGEAPIYQIRKKNEILYYGSNFLNVIERSRATGPVQIQRSDHHDEPERPAMQYRKGELLFHHVLLRDQ